MQYTQDPGDNTLGSTPLHLVWPYTDICTIRTPEKVEDAYRSACTTDAVCYIFVILHVLHAHTCNA